MDPRRDAPGPPGRARFALGWIAAGLTIGAVGACDIPRDPEGTLHEVAGGTMRVGVTEAPPWVVKGPGGGPSATAEGAEAVLVGEFARSLGARIEWIWGSTEDHMEALGRYDLDLAIGGYTAATPWAKHVGTTSPFYTERWTIAPAPGSPAPRSGAQLSGRTVTVPPSGPSASRVRGHGGVPAQSEEPWHAEGLVAGPAWRLHALGRDTAGVDLHQSRHVMAVPPGENGFLMALERALEEADVDALLRATMQEPPR